MCHEVNYSSYLIIIALSFLMIAVNDYLKCSFVLMVWMWSGDIGKGECSPPRSWVWSCCWNIVVRWLLVQGLQPHLDQMQHLVVLYWRWHNCSACLLQLIPLLHLLRMRQVLSSSQSFLVSTSLLHGILHGSWNWNSFSLASLSKLLFLTLLFPYYLLLQIRCNLLWGILLVSSMKTASSYAKACT